MGLLGHPMNRGALALVLLVALSGCFGGGSGPGDDDEPVTPKAPITAITPIGETVLVDLPGHRIAEFMVARNPNDPMHLITAYGDYDSPGGVLNCAFAVSRDGGKSWTVSDPIPGFGGPYLEFDGWIDFDEWGGVHGVCIQQAAKGAPDAQAWTYYFNSADGGMTWSAAQHIPTDPPTRSTDKSVVAVGRDGTVYAGTSGLIGTTKDNGTTWKTMADVPGGFAALNGFVEDNNGTMFLLGLGEGDDVWLQRTNDGGESWEHAVAGQFHIPPGYNDQNRWVEQRPWTTLPTLAHDPLTDELWISFQSWDEGYNGYRIHLWRSTDHGITFTEVPAPDFPSPTCSDPCHVTHPAIGFDFGGNMALIVQLTQDGGHLKEVYVTASGDRGQSWLPPFEISKTDGMGPDAQGWSNPNAFAPLPENGANIAAGLARDPAGAKTAAAGIALSAAVSELQIRWNGEYWGMASSPHGFVVMWIDHSNDGRPQLYSRLFAVE